MGIGSAIYSILLLLIWQEKTSKWHMYVLLPKEKNKTFMLTVQNWIE